MTADSQGWLDWAVRRPGPANKVYQQRNAMVGLALHSAEGYLAGTLGELMKPEREASWHFTNDIDGTLYQHYPLPASTWASGSPGANTRFVAVESTGLAGTPLNKAQVRNMLRLISDYEQFANITISRLSGTLREHNELVREYGGGATACPSGRYQPLYEALRNEGGDDMTENERKQLEAASAGVYQLQQQVFGAPGLLQTDGGEDAYVDETFAGLVRTVAELRQEIRLLRAATAGAAGAEVDSTHTHILLGGLELSGPMQRDDR